MAIMAIVISLFLLQGKDIPVDKDPMLERQSTLHEINATESFSYINASDMSGQQKPKKQHYTFHEEINPLPDIDLKSNAEILPEDILSYVDTYTEESLLQNEWVNKLSEQNTRNALMDALIYMMKEGGVREKCAALFTAGSFGEKLMSHTRPTNAEDIDTNDEANKEQINQKDYKIISNIFLAGLTSQEDDVRIQAAISLNELSDEISNPLCLFALSQEDADMKLEVLKPHLGSKRHEDITLFFHALDDDDATISGYAKENLNYVLGVTFETSDEAFEWWEHHMP